MARAVGVSPSTVSNAFNRPERLSPALRERVLRTAAELGYGGPDPVARSLRSGRAGAIGVVFRRSLADAFDEPATVELLRGLSDVTDPRQLALVLVPGLPQEHPSIGPAVRNAAVDGLIVYSMSADDPLFEAARRRRLPTVIVDSPAVATWRRSAADRRRPTRSSSGSTTGPPPRPPCVTCSTSAIAASPS